MLELNIEVQTMWCCCAYDLVQRPRSLQDRRTTFENINPMLVRCKVTISVVQVAGLYCFSSDVDFRFVKSINTVKKVYLAAQYKCDALSHLHERTYILVVAHRVSRKTIFHRKPLTLTLYRPSLDEIRLRLTMGAAFEEFSKTKWNWKKSNFVHTIKKCPTALARQPDTKVLKSVP